MNVLFLGFFSELNFSLNADFSEPGYLKETDCKHYVPPDSEALQSKENSRIKKLWASLPDVSLSSLTLDSSDANFSDRSMALLYKVQPSFVLLLL